MNYGGVYRSVCLEVLVDRIRVQVPQLFASEMVTIFECAGLLPSVGDNGWVAFESGLAENPVWMGSNGWVVSTASPPSWTSDDPPSLWATYSRTFTDVSPDVVTCPGDATGGYNWAFTRRADPVSDPQGIEVTVEHGFEAVGPTYTNGLQIELYTHYNPADGTGMVFWVELGGYSGGGAFISWEAHDINAAGRVGGYSEPTGGAITPITPATSYTFRSEADGNNYRFLINGTQVASTIYAGLAGHCVGFGSTWEPDVPASGVVPLYHRSVGV